LTDGKHKVTVPRHETIKKGTLLSIIQQTGLTKEKFLKLLKKQQAFWSWEWELNLGDFAYFSERKEIGERTSRSETATFNMKA
jgi:hypothetical protein